MYIFAKHNLKNYTMRRITLLLVGLALVSAVSCQNKVHSDVVNFVKQKAGVRVQSVEVIKQDSVLVSILGPMQMAMMAHKFAAGEMGMKDYTHYVDSMMDVYKCVNLTWAEPDAKQSVCAQERFRGQWRKVYQVRVLLADGEERTPRVLMDRDGITPRQLEQKALEGLVRLAEACGQGYEDLTNRLDMEPALRRRYGKKTSDVDEMYRMFIKEQSY